MAVPKEGNLLNRLESEELAVPVPVFLLAFKQGPGRTKDSGLPSTFQYIKLHDLHQIDFATCSTSS